MAVKNISTFDIEDAQMIGEEDLTNFALSSTEIEQAGLNEPQQTGVNFSPSSFFYIGTQSEHIYFDGPKRLIRSSDFSAGVSGWIIRGDGSVEFNDGIFRGSLVAGSISIGTSPNWFRVDTSGNTWWGAANFVDAPASITPAGVIKMRSGDIAGWTIDNTSIKDASGSVGFSSAVTGGDDIRLWAGNTTPASAPFYVTEAGVLFASSATISGSITATTGAIGGFDIGSDYIRDAANTFGLASTVTVGDDVRFWAGAAFASRATAPFRVTEAGVFVASSATITGVINANTGYIGGATGWVVTANNIKDVAGLVGFSNTVTGGDDIRIWAGNATPASAPFRVTESGALVASSATITGVVTANTGFIGGATGWVVAANTIKDVAGLVGLSNVVTGGDDIRFWAGNTTPSSASFRVTESGALFASSATITGAITATSGAIGGWVVNATSIKDVAGLVGLSSAVTGGDDYRFWAGHVTPASAPFSVTEAGVLKATSGTIGGNTLGTNFISSTSFVSGPLGSGWRIQSNGSAEFQDVAVRGILRTSVFEKDTISAVNGMVLISKADVLASDMTALDASTVVITGETTFVANEVIRIKDGTNDEWMLVTNAASAPTYTVTRDLAGSYASNNNPVWKKGTAVVSMGVGAGSKTGFILLDSSSASSPFIDIYTRNSNTYSDTSLKARMGWLQGIVDSDVGLSSTDVWGLYSDSAYLKGTIVANSGRIGGASGWVITSNNIKDVAGLVGFSNTATGGDDIRIWAGNATPASAPFYVTESGVLVASSATISGSITATTGAVGGFNIGSDYIRDAADSFGLASTVTGGNDVRFWAGDTFANRATAPFRVYENGDITANQMTINGGIIDGTSTVNGSMASNVQQRAENIYTSGVFVGHKGDGLTVTNVNTTITRNYYTTDANTGGSFHTWRLSTNGGLGQFDRSSIGGANTSFNFNNNYDFFIRWKSVAGATNANLFWGILANGSVEPDPTVGIGATMTARHAAFIAATDGNIYASVADGTTQSLSAALTGITITTFNNYRIVLTSGSTALFYVNDVLKATLSSNVPSGTTLPNLFLGAQSTTSTKSDAIFYNNYILKVA